MAKHVSTLREIAKFASGLVAADFFVGVWLYAKDMLPMDFLGMTVTQEVAKAGMAFDAVLFLILIYYAWHIALPTRQKGLLIAVGTLLSIVSILHLLRLVFGIEVNIGGWMAPFWLSWLGTIVAAYLAYASIQFARHK